MGIISAKTQREVLFSLLSNAVDDADMIFPHFISCSWVREVVLPINNSDGCCMHISLNITFVGSYSDQICSHKCLCCSMMFGQLTSKKSRVFTRESLILNFKSQSF